MIRFLNFCKHQPFDAFNILKQTKGGLLANSTLSAQIGFFTNISEIYFFEFLELHL